MTDRPDPLWRTAPDRVDLAEGSVHVWRVGLARPESDVAELAEVLSAAERARADRFRFARHGRRHVVATAALRQILGRYLDLDPGALDFSAGKWGKPYLPGSELRFNLSHSGETALVAVARSHEVGVDVEEIRPIDDALNIARRYFSPGESAQLVALTDAEAVERAFFTCWTRKEAFIKAVGEGLSHPLDTFEVSFLPEETVALRIEGAESPRWTLVDLPVSALHAGALVVEKGEKGNSPVVMRWHW